MKIDFQKYADSLVPTIVQDSNTGRVLMLGFMDQDSFEQTQHSGKVAFFSRSRRGIWTKGETSGNYLVVENILVDCDSDTILIKASPSGPVCHSGADTCFGEKNEPADFLPKLEQVIKDRKVNPTENSYTSKLFAKGLNRISQKVGEEAVELIIEAKDSDLTRFKSEAADLIFHLLVLCVEKDVAFESILEELKERAKPKA